MNKAMKLLIQGKVQGVGYRRWFAKQAWEFGKYKVIEKNQTIMICEINHRNELDELVFIRIDPNQKKNIRSFGRRVTFTYSKQPSVREMRQDFAQYLS
jgi:hypothetical protein